MIFHLPNIRAYVMRDFNQSTVSGFLSTSDIDAYANEGYMKYCGWLMQSNQGFFEVTANLDIVSGAETVALPTFFSGTTTSSPSLHRVCKLEKVFANSRVPLTYRRRFNEPNATTASGVSASYLPTYDFRDNNLVLEPTPASSETAGLRIWYKSLPPRLQSGNAVAGAGSTITLDSTADERDGYYAGQRIIITSGVGAGQIRTISNYVGSTKVATVSVAWGTQPTAASVFSTMLHDDFPEMFHELVALFATKKAFLKERSTGAARAYDEANLKELEKQLLDYCAIKTEGRVFVQPWHPELYF